MMEAGSGKDAREYSVVVPAGEQTQSSQVENNNGPPEGRRSFSYVLRGLKDESEIEDWTRFCASVFSYKENPPTSEYFARHFWNDPDRDCSMIRVAIYQGTIVASCRVFQRNISLGNGKHMVAGGIGEVCTDANHRKRGLSRELLRDCIDIMTQRGYPVSLLHAAPAFVPFYQSFGYVSSVTSWCEITVNRFELVKQVKDNVGGIKTRLANFPMDSDQLMSLHHEYSERRWAGCIVRSKEYWNRYVSEELQDSLWLCCHNNDDEIQGWASIRSRGSSFQLREFGCRSVDQIRPIFSILLEKCISNAYRECDETNPTFVLQVPALVWQEIGVDAPFIVNTVSRCDTGWMYKALTDDPVLIQELSSNSQHMIWPTDSF